MKTMIKLLVCLTGVINGTAHAEIVTDGTIGASTTLSGQMIIPQNLGKLVGSNLFHSFNTFNIKTGETATFQGDPAILNVISRVTGGVSLLDGLLKSEIGHAHFYFINPAGVTFGANAKLDVPATFHVSTASTLLFENGKSFNSASSDISQLTVNPVSFGFLETSPVNFGTITINSSQLSVAQGQALDLVANTITIQQSAGNQIARLAAPAGEIRLIAFKGAGNVSTEPDGLNYIPPLPSGVSPVSSGGKMSIDNASTVRSDGDGGGRIVLWGGDIGIKNGATISANNTGATKITDKIDSVTVTSNTLNITGSFSQIGADTSGSGNAGTVTVTSGVLNVLSGGLISSSTHSAGNAGRINVTATQLTIDGQNNRQTFTGISSSALADKNNVNTWAGNAGKVTVSSDILTVQNLGGIRTSTFTQGNAGDVKVSANLLTLDAKSNPFALTGIASQARAGSTGNAGNITVAAKDKLSLLNGAQITSNSTGATTTLAAATGNAGTVTVTSPLMTLNNNSFITTSAKTGKGGDITVNSNRITLQNSALTTSVDAGDKGNGGDITVSAHTLVMNTAAIQANADGGSGGDINLHLQVLIPSQYQLIEGGKKIIWHPYQEGFNVIQAASQTGVNGTINVTSPTFNISGSLTGLDAQIALPALVNDPCSNSSSSSLARGSKGGLPTFEAQKVFVPTIPDQNTPSQHPAALSQNQQTTIHSLASKENYPCAALFFSNLAD